MRRLRLDLPLALVIMALHIAAVWGYTGTFWGDLGRWWHEVDRFAKGELPYRDFQWHFPPLGMWLVGGAARAIGSEARQIMSITSAFAMLLMVPFVVYARIVLNRVDAVCVAACLVLALAYAQTVGAPVPLGLYTPAALIGGLCITTAACVWVRYEQRSNTATAITLGCFAALAVLSKQDFWIPAAFLVGVMLVRHRRVSTAISAAAVTAVGVLVIVQTAGVEVLRPLAGGFGHVALSGGAGFPSWERLTVDAFVTATIATLVLCALSVARGQWLIKPLVGASAAMLTLGAVFVFVTMQTTAVAPDALPTPAQDVLRFHIESGNPMFRPALGWLRQRVSQTPLPVLLSPTLLVLFAIQWRQLPSDRRTQLALLLGLAMTLRARRLFSGVEWFEFLLTLPVYIASIELLVASRFASNEPARTAHAAPNSSSRAVPQLIMHRRLHWMINAAIVVAAVLLYRTLGRGPGTTRIFAPFASTRGTMHWSTRQVGEYRRILATLDSLDPSRSRPLVAFGYTGGFNYFMQRRNPFPMTQDFFFSGFHTDSILAERPNGLLLIDNPFMERESWGAAAFDVTEWEQRRVAAPYPWYDRPRFEKLRSGCTLVPIAKTAFRVYDCP